MATGTALHTRFRFFFIVIRYALVLVPATYVHFECFSSVLECVFRVFFQCFRVFSTSVFYYTESTHNLYHQVPGTHWYQHAGRYLSLTTTGTYVQHAHHSTEYLLYQIRRCSTLAGPMLAHKNTFFTPEQQ